MAKLKFDDAGRTADEFDVTALPTLLVFKDGEVVSRIVGAVEKPELARMLDEALEP